MLGDNEILLLQNDPEYKRVLSKGLKHFFFEQKENDESFWDLKDKIDGIKIVTRFSMYLWKKKRIRKELYFCTTSFLERFLNHDVRIERNADFIKDVCEGNKNTHIWMRFDEPRVDCLFSRSKAILSDAEFRILIKKYSQVSTPNQRLDEIYNELRNFHERTLRQIRIHKTFQQQIGILADSFYSENKREMESKFLYNLKNGIIGFIPDNKNSENES